jgi:hypothetical protein
LHREAKKNVALMKKSNPESYAEVIRALKSPAGTTRSQHQRQEAMLFVEEFTRECVVSKKVGVLLITKRQYVAMQRFTNGYSRKKAVLKMQAALNNPKIFKKKENGILVIAFKKPTEVNKEDIMRSSHSFKGDSFQMSQDAAKSMLSGEGPTLNPKSMKAFTGNKKLSGFAE